MAGRGDARSTSGRGDPCSTSTGPPDGEKSASAVSADGRSRASRPGGRGGERMRTASSRFAAVSPATKPSLRSRREPWIDGSGEFDIDGCGVTRCTAAGAFLVSLTTLSCFSRLGKTTRRGGRVRARRAGGGEKTTDSDGRGRGRALLLLLDIMLLGVAPALERRPRADGLRGGCVNTRARRLGGFSRKRLGDLAKPPDAGARRGDGAPLLAPRALVDGRVVAVDEVGHGDDEAVVLVVVPAALLEAGDFFLFGVYGRRLGLGGDLGAAGRLGAGFSHNLAGFAGGRVPKRESGTRERFCLPADFRARATSPRRSSTARARP